MLSMMMGGGGASGKPPPPSFCKDLVNTSVILAEIKKYALAI